MARQMHGGRDGQGHAPIGVSRPVPSHLSRPSEERDEQADAAARATRDARLDRDAPGLRDDIARLMAAFPGTTGRGMRITIGGEVVWPPRKEE